VLLTHVQGTGAAGQGGLDSFLFGQAAAMLGSDLWIMAGLTGVSVLLVAALWKEFKLVAFDPDFAATLGLPVAVLEAVLTAAIALAVVVGLQMVGVVLMAAMVIAPAAAARQWTKRLGPMVMLAAAFGTASGVAGALVSAAARGLATGPLIVLAASALVLASILLAPGRGVLWEILRRRRDRRALDESQVLVTLQALTARHDDPNYLSEQGMIDTYHGLATRGTLARLRARGLVRAVRHLPHEGLHWELTPEGRERALRIRSGLDRAGPAGEPDRGRA
jgi:manganese/zinc/iron transport system permease protein